MNPTGSEAADTSGPGLVPCLDCGSRNVSLAAPKSGEAYTLRDAAYAQCRDCGHIFRIPESEAQLILRSWAGKPVTDERACHKCGYMLKTLRVGERCPECGSPILPPPAADYLAARRKPKEHTIWALPIALAVVFVYWRLSRFWATPGARWGARGVDAFLLGLTVYLLLKGAIGLRTGSIETRSGIGVGSNVRTGRARRVVSFLFIGAGLAALVAFVLALVGML